jgi:hypothetical protein
MIRSRLFYACFLLPFAISFGHATINGAEPDQPGIEVDARGPVHEAFARPWQANTAPNEPVDKKPPNPIPEEPAAEKPAGKNVQWIPGYWQWDTDRKDFIWVTGLWRDMPANRRWVMGYWAQTADGYRWVSGHFADAAEPDNQYVPEPPENRDQGPTTAPPDDHSSYVPASWFYGDIGYSNRDGYWTDRYDDRVWVPAQYNWSPYGYTFCSGYWDFPFANRGLLFAPAYFNSPYWNNPGWFYRPSYAIGFGGLFANLFVGYGYSHYYFGDYYSRSYLGRGIYPWFWHSRYNYDPYWAHQRWTNRGNPNWAAGMQSNYIGRVNGTMGLPPRTLSAQSSLNGRAGAGTSPRMVNSLAQVRQSGQRLEAVSQQQRMTQQRAAQQIVSKSQQLSQSAPRASTPIGRATANSMTPIGASRGLASSQHGTSTFGGQAGRQAMPGSSIGRSNSSATMGRSFSSPQMGRSATPLPGLSAVPSARSYSAPSVSRPSYSAPSFGGYHGSPSSGSFHGGGFHVGASSGDFHGGGGGGHAGGGHGGGHR